MRDDEPDRMLLLCSIRSYYCELYAHILALARPAVGPATAAMVVHDVLSFTPRSVLPVFNTT